MRTPATRPEEQGFMLVGLIVAIFLILLVLSIAAPKVARGLRREREVEAVHRGNQYVRAVQVYYRKVGHYPGSLEQLEKTNNIRFLRRRYEDPMTGKPDWKLIHLGEAKTTVKGFFGQPLNGLAGSGGLGSAAGMSSGIGSGNSNSSTFGSSSSGSSSFGSASSGPTSSGSSTSSSGSDTPPSTFGSSGSSGSTGFSSQSATSFQGTGAPIMGVGSAASGNSIIVLNEQTTYPTWEFIYDPRIEQLKAKASLFGGGMTSTSASSLGSAAPSSGFGSSTGSGFGSSTTSGTNSTSGTSTTGSGSTGTGTQPQPQ
ncbi:type II secretion system protein [Granulicella arctica]|uniref:Type II secretory pathway pseudopilin PulG n=1 Tax=Granulicella arctica TaxID=940613 RepID=A0A7Y9TR05_9BACT|nr:type II secretion system protein [Granulicella arctica]NYF77773.1 type II secretory pathway pseudopilin PulG [Granulicella arctica]